MVIIADNQALTRAGLLRLFEADDCRVAGDRKVLAALLGVSPAAAVVLDYSLFDFNGLEHLLIFVRRFHEARWLIVGADFPTDLLRLLSSEPAVGFLTKDAAEDEWRAAVRALRAGERFVGRAVSEQLAARHDAVPPGALTATETDVLRLIARGLTAREIAGQRHSSVHTIVTHKKNIFRKLSVSTAYEATRYAMRAGLADPVEYYI